MAVIIRRRVTVRCGKRYRHHIPYEPLLLRMNGSGVNDVSMRCLERFSRTVGRQPDTVSAVNTVLRTLGVRLDRRYFSQLFVCLPLRLFTPSPGCQMSDKLVLDDGWQGNNVSWVSDHGQITVHLLLLGFNPSRCFRHLESVQDRFQLLGSGHWRVLPQQLFRFFHLRLCSSRFIVIDLAFLWLLDYLVCIVTTQANHTHNTYLIKALLLRAALSCENILITSSSSQTSIIGFFFDPKTTGLLRLRALSDETVSRSFCTLYKREYITYEERLQVRAKVS